MTEITCTICSEPIETCWSDKVGDCIECNSCNTEYDVVWNSPLTLLESSPEDDFEEY
ncbi:MAG: hypothetical protein GY950_19820 [bacterium]|nr:hypothetical protein [bacterium]